MHERARVRKRGAEERARPYVTTIPVTIAPYSQKDIPAVKEFNRRLRTAGVPKDYVFSESPVPRWLPRDEGAQVYDEYFLALEGDAVRGAFALKHQEFSFGGARAHVVYYHHPFGEGIIDRKYAHVGSHMLMYAARAHPLLFALGMGGYDRPLPRMLMALGWEHCWIPMYFRVNHPARFLRNMRKLRNSAGKRLLADIAAFSGVGWAVSKIVQARTGRLGMRAVRVEAAAEFGDWADEIWDDCGAAYSMIAVRDGKNLRTLYPLANENFTRLKVSLGGRAIGWAVIADTQRRGHEEYGDLRVGTILDGLARPQHARLVTGAASRVLLDHGVDVVISNQSHEAWQRALRQCGFLPARSNSVLAVSKKLSERIQPFAEAARRCHINRGDGDSLMPYAYL